MPKPAIKKNEPQPPKKHEPPKKPVQSARPVSQPNVPPGDDDDEQEEGGRKRRYLAENSNLPLISVIDDQPTMDLAKELLEEAQQLTHEQEVAAERLKEIKLYLSGVARDWSLPGMRYGKFGLSYSGDRTKRSLNKGLLIENGVDPEVIAASYKESKPYVDARFIEYD